MRGRSIRTAVATPAGTFREPIYGIFFRPAK
jgi:hypothetical protein